MSDLQVILALLVGLVVVYVGMFLVCGWLFDKFKEL